MAHVLNIVDGSTTIQLAENATNKIYLLEYIPVSPSQTAITVDNATSDGGEQPYTLYRNVTESAEVMITATNRSNFITTVELIDLAFLNAQLRQKYLIPDPVYLSFTPDGYSTAYRSEILTGHIEYDQDGLDYEQWGNIKVKARIFWTRRYFWESVTLTEIPLTNNHGTAITGGIQVDNTTNTTDSKSNYVEIAAASAVGVRPFPVKITMTGASSGQVIRTIYMSHGFIPTVTTLEHILEAEDATGGTIGPSPPYSAASGGNYASGTTTTTVAATLLTWTISAAQVSKMKGDFFNFIVRFYNDPPVNINYWFTVEDLIGTTLFTSEVVSPISGDQLLNLGVVRLPTNQLANTSNGSLKILLKAQNTVSATNTTDVDYLQLTPLDCQRIIEAIASYGLQLGETVVDDQINNNLYADISGVQFGRYSCDDELFQIQPYKLQRIYFNTMNTGGNAPKSTAMTVKIEYRPRRLTL